MSHILYPIAITTLHLALSTLLLSEEDTYFSRSSLSIMVAFSQEQILHTEDRFVSLLNFANVYIREKMTIGRTILVIDAVYVRDSANVNVQLLP